MKVLIGCEMSGIVREAFRKRGHEAYSCDLIPAADGSRHHFQMDIMKLVSRKNWDLIIIHPPCTAIALSGNRWYGKGMPRNQERIAALLWTTALWREAMRNCGKVCLENPMGVLSSMIGKPAQTVQPWQYGHGELKGTCFWLQGLPVLTPTKIVKGREARIHKMAPSKDRGMLRSLTYQGIADAMAEQWG